MRISSSILGAALIAGLFNSGSAHADDFIAADAVGQPTVRLIASGASGELPLGLDASGRVLVEAVGPLELHLDGLLADGSALDAQLHEGACAELGRDGTCKVKLELLAFRGTPTGDALELVLAGVTPGSLRLSAGSGGWQTLHVEAERAVTVLVGMVSDVGGLIEAVPFEPAMDEPPPVADSGLGTYSVLTYNVAGLPQTALADDNFTPDEQEVHRAEVIAGHILAGGFDIVAINEAFDDTMRDTLASKLLAQNGGPYPYAVLEAWADGNFEPDNGLPIDHQQDSGLMLFSKFPPVKRNLGFDCNLGNHLTTVGFEHPEDVVSFTCSAGFAEFHALVGDDALSQKGYLWAFVQNPANGKVMALVVSHAQANYPDNAARAERMDNMAEIAKLSSLVFQPTDEVLVLGDLNVIGDEGAGSEYEEAIAGANSIFGSVGLVDELRASTSPADPAFSWDGEPGPNGNMVAKDSGGQERLDYMLTNTPVGDYAPCYQHMTLQRGYDTAWGDASDHYGLAAVIGPTIPHCDPARATKDQIDVPIAGALSHANAYQWHRFENAGDDTWSVSLYSPDADMRLDVYRAADLSTPVALLEGDTTFVEDDRQSVAVVAPVGPFYIRVRTADPAATAGYLLQVKPHQGLSWDDYIWLHSGHPKHATFPQMLASDPVERLYFRFQQESLFTTALGNQEHRFSGALPCDAQNGCMLASFEVWDEQHAAPELVTGVGASLLSAATTGLGNFSERFYLTLRRDPENLEREVTVTWTTDLKTIDLQDLTCVEQEDYTGDDHIYAKLYIDGQRLKPGEPMDLDYGKFDTFGNNENPAHGTSLDTHAIRFKTKLALRLYEADDADDDDFLGQQGLVTSDFDKNLLLPAYPVFIETPYTLHFAGDDAWYQLNVWVENAEVGL